MVPVTKAQNQGWYHDWALNTQSNVTKITDSEKTTLTTSNTTVLMTNTEQPLRTFIVFKGSTSNFTYHFIFFLWCQPSAIQAPHSFVNHKNPVALPLINFSDAVENNFLVSFSDFPEDYFFQQLILHSSFLSYTNWLTLSAIQTVLHFKDWLTSCFTKLPGNILLPLHLSKLS